MVLSWNDHVNEITTKANKTLNFLSRNLRTCSVKSKERAYKALVPSGGELYHNLDYRGRKATPLHFLQYLN